MNDKTIHAIVFTEDEAIIEFSLDENTPFHQAISMRIPWGQADQHPQVGQDLREMMEDSYTLLESVLAARIGTPSAPQEMGR